MSTVHLNLLSVLLLLLPFSEGTTGEHFAMWSGCTTNTKQHLSPEDLKDIKATCSEKKDKGVCFGEEVSRLCKERNPHENNGALCTFHTIFYNRFPGTKETQAKSLYNAMHSGCEQYIKDWNKPEIECLYFKWSCLQKFQSEQLVDFGVERVEKKAKHWCGSYSGSTVQVEDVDQGEDIVYRCYEKLSNSSTLATRDWLTDDVARCTFHSMFQAQNENYTTRMHRACEYLKTFGYHGYCGKMEKKCHGVLESSYHPTSPPTASSDHNSKAASGAAKQQGAANSVDEKSSVIYSCFVISVSLFLVLK